MNRSTIRICEIIALWLIAIGALAVLAYMVHVGRTGEAFGFLVGIIPLAINAIRNTGQAQAMQSMVDHLAKSTPTAFEDKP